jgi:hypothetical protein
MNDKLNFFVPLIEDVLYKNKLNFKSTNFDYDRDGNVYFSIILFHQKISFNTLFEISKIIDNKFFDIDKNCSYPGIYFRDDLAQESFTVYDHPQVIIFSRL